MGRRNKQADTATDTSADQYRRLYETEAKAHTETKKDLHDAVRMYNELVDAYNILKSSMSTTIIKALGGMAADMTKAGFSSPNFAKLQVEDKEVKDSDVV